MPLFIGTILGLDYQPISKADLLYAQNVEASQSMLTEEEYLAPSGFTPWFALRWETFDVAGTVNLQNRYRIRLVGDDKQETNIGVLQLGLDFRPQLDWKGPVRSYLGLGMFGHIPLVSARYSDAIQQEDLSALIEQYRAEIFSLHGRFSIGADYNIGSRFSFGVRIDQRLSWDPIYTDDFGVEYLFKVQSEGSVTLTWLL
ncbi:MAG: hypothetical protein VX278_14485 [Myxococcota bacterium]|nr:hypothetical protein [Myxococcota bacterium]